jgi:hypothetical protein
MEVQMRAATVPRSGKTAATALLIAAIGVVLQIAGGADYPPVPPVFFILLVPAALVMFGRWWWRSVPALLAGAFLTFGTFASGEAHRLIDSNAVDAGGLWLQMLAVVIATIAAAAMTIRSYQTGEVGGFVKAIRALLAKRTAQTMGVLFLTIGAIGLVMADEDFGTYHNLLHALTGVVAAAVGFAGTVPQARIACVAVGAVYLGLGGGGIVLGEPATGAWDTGLFTVSHGDNIFHSLIGAMFLAGALLTDRDRPLHRH